MSRLFALVFPIVLLSKVAFGAALCTGHFANPITDVCWQCLFPLTIGSVPVSAGTEPDTPNPASPIQICPAGVGYRPGMAVGFWEPFALTDVTRQPFCMVNLGGVQLDMGSEYGFGGEEPKSAGHSAFYWVHWYKFPLMYWLNILTYVGCMQTGDMDVGYLSEVDPTWDDDEAAAIINPDAVLFSNPISQAACAADSISALAYLPIDPLFWCMGAQGAAYPLTGHVFEESSAAQSSVLLSERMDYKLHREGVVMDSIGVDTAVCNQYPTPIMPKSRYRYQMVNPIPDALLCHPFGQSTLTWEAGHVLPSTQKNFGYLIWRKRNCAFM